MSESAPGRVACFLLGLSSMKVLSFRFLVTPLSSASSRACLLTLPLVSSGAALRFGALGISIFSGAVIVSSTSSSLEGASTSVVVKQPGQNKNLLVSNGDFEVDPRHNALLFLFIDYGDKRLASKAKFLQRSIEVVVIVIIVV
jgi:hypothetical protein